MKSVMAFKKALVATLLLMIANPAWAQLSATVNRSDLKNGGFVPEKGMNFPTYILLDGDNRVVAVDSADVSMSVFFSFNPEEKIKAAFEASVSRFADKMDKPAGESPANADAMSRALQAWALRPNQAGLAKAMQLPGNKVILLTRVNKEGDVNDGCSNELFKVVSSKLPPDACVNIPVDWAKTSE